MPDRTHAWLWTAHMHGCGPHTCLPVDSRSLYSTRCPLLCIASSPCSRRSRLSIVREQVLSSLSPIFIFFVMTFVISVDSIRFLLLEFYPSRSGECRIWRLPGSGAPLLRPSNLLSHQSIHPLSHPISHLLTRCTRHRCCSVRNDVLQINLRNLKRFHHDTPERKGRPFVVRQNKTTTSPAYTCLRTPGAAQLPTREPLGQSFQNGKDYRGHRRNLNTGPGATTPKPTACAARVPVVPGEGGPHVSTCPHIHVSTYPRVHVSTCPPVPLSTCPPVHLSTCPPLTLLCPAPGYPVSSQHLLFRTYTLPCIQGRAA